MRSNADRTKYFFNDILTYTWSIIGAEISLNSFLAITYDNLIFKKSLLLYYLTYFDLVCLNFQLKLVQTLTHQPKFTIFTFFIFFNGFYFLRKFPKFPRQISAAILIKLYLRISLKNILRFIAFNLIFHLTYIF